MPLARGDRESAFLSVYFQNDVFLSLSKGDGGERGGAELFTPPSHTHPRAPAHTHTREHRKPFVFQPLDNYDYYHPFSPPGSFSLHPSVFLSVSLRRMAADELPLF